MMVKRIFAALPGPLPVKIVESAVIIVILLVALHFFYTWLGIFLDPGGAVG
jgi:hypothetical protein